MNGHTTGYFAQTQKLEQLYQTTLLPLAVLSGEGQFQAMLLVQARPLWSNAAAQPRLQPRT